MTLKPAWDRDFGGALPDMLPETKARIALEPNTRKGYIFSVIENLKNKEHFSDSAIRGYLYQRALVISGKDAHKWLSRYYKERN